MSDINVVMLTGRLGKDPELRYMQNGKPVCSFSIATSKKYTGSDGEKKEITEWNEISVFGAFAEIANRYMAKGKRVALTGELKTNSWEDADGSKRSKKIIVARDVHFIDYSDESQQQGFQQPAYQQNGYSQQNYQQQNYRQPAGNQQPNFQQPNYHQPAGNQQPPNFQIPGEDDLPF